MAADVEFTYYPGRDGLSESVQNEYDIVVNLPTNRRQSRPTHRVWAKTVSGCHVGFRRSVLIVQKKSGIASELDNGSVDPKLLSSDIHLYE